MVWKAIKAAAPAIATAAAGPVAGAITTGAIGYASAKEQGTQSKQAARENREWQERMSSTAYQRAAADLEAAGLNRILALGSPATTPGGAVAQFPAYGSVGGSAAAGAHAGTSAYQSYTQARQADANIGLMESQTALTTQNVANAMVQNGILTQNEMQQVAKTELYQKVVQFASETMDIIQEGPQGIDNLKKYLTGGAVLDGIKWAAKGAKEDVKQGVIAIAKEIFKNSPVGWLTGKIQEAIAGGSE